MPDRSMTPSPFPPPKHPSMPAIGEGDDDQGESSGQWQQPTTEEIAARALRIGLENRRSIGRPSIPATKQKASGLFEVLEDVGGNVKTIGAKLDVVATAVATRDGASERRVGYVSVLGEKIISALIPMILVGLFAYFTGHLHWSTAATTPPVTIPKGQAE